MSEEKRPEQTEEQPEEQTEECACGHHEEEQQCGCGGHHDHHGGWGMHRRMHMMRRRMWRHFASLTVEEEVEFLEEVKARLEERLGIVNERLTKLKA
jgi:hypothetical protein